MNYNNNNKDSLVAQSVLRRTSKVYNQTLVTKWKNNKHELVK